MATKHVHIEGVGDVMLVRTRVSRQLKLSVTQKGVRVSLPAWTPYKIAEQFARTHRDWIIRHQTKLPAQEFVGDGQRVGRLHTLQFARAAAQTTSRVTGTKIIVYLRPSETPRAPAVQRTAVAACERALRKEAEQLLPPRLARLAETHGLAYRSVAIKKLTRRWGSCDSHRNIVLNLYLTELPWEYIDYVLLHELTHTVHMHHGPDFWALLTLLEPRARDIRNQLRNYQPSLKPRQA